MLIKQWLHICKCRDNNAIKDAWKVSWRCHKFATNTRYGQIDVSNFYTFDYIDVRIMVVHYHYLPEKSYNEFVS